tara:strand:+ start:250 stop:939 length:690 start_codon:yes stop_codon:yes gene_type:complete
MLHAETEKRKTAPQTRRTFMKLGSAAALGGLLAACQTTQPEVAPVEPRIDPVYLDMYGPMPQERFPVPAVDLRQLDPAYYRRVVPDPTGETPGTLVVDTADRYLYLVRADGQAVRYGVGIGRAGFGWSGQGTIAYKKKWPTWTPPAEMIEREPELEKWADGQPPGLTNPLGARALYIFQDGRDTLYRLHGTGEVWSIGRAVSSGCVRLLHQDVIDLYSRVPNGAPIIVV